MIATNSSFTEHLDTVYSESIPYTASGSFSAVVSSLSPSTKYYYKAFMTVHNGTEYEEIVSSYSSFTTSIRPSTGMPQWMEIPAMSDSDLANFYAHDVNGNKYASGSTRNWSCLWSPTHGVSYWVAYPMYDDLNEVNVSRKDAFGYDPIVPKDEQPDICDGTYKKDANGTSYSRGHQIPSSDRLSSKAINKTTFYATNMTPQIQSFNGGIWLGLENKVKDWANASDTLYVVTGCLVEGSTRSVADNAGNGSITVPTHYYKALLRKKGSTYTACAYIYSHFNSNNSFSESNRISIDDLETQTGIDFFPNLIRVLGETEAARIESTATAF